MKKLVSIVILLALLVVSISACTKDESSVIDSNSYYGKIAAYQSELNNEYGEIFSDYSTTEVPLDPDEAAIYLKDLTNKKKDHVDKSKEIITSMKKLEPSQSAKSSKEALDKTLDGIAAQLDVLNTSLTYTDEKAVISNYGIYETQINELDVIITSINESYLKEK